MNEQQPYEKHLTDKLQSLKPAGDAATHWPVMRSLLDKEMPDKRPPGLGGRWWMYGIIAGILLTGSVFWINAGSKEETAANAAAPSSVTDQKSKEEKKNDINLHSHPVQRQKDPAMAASDGNENNAGISGNTSVKNINGADEPDRVSVKANSSVQASPDERSSVVKEVSPAGKTAIPDNSDAAIRSKSVPGKIVWDEKPNTTKNDNNALKPGKGLGKTGAKADKTVTADETELASGTSAIARAERSKQYSKLGYTEESAAKKLKSTGINNTGRNNGWGEEAAANPEEESKAALIHFAIENLSKDFNTTALVKDSLEPDYAVLLKPTPMPSRSRFKEETDRVKALKNRVVGTGDEKNFVIGLSLPLAFPLSDQRVVAYNFNGGANTAVDYLPAPHVQYHFNQFSYLQAELQIGSPQYIQPVLLDQHKYELSGSTSNYRFITSSLFARKLYYFNLPLGIHYSPFKNFYLGSGLQFSSLMSGIGFSEKRGYSSLSPSSSDTLISQNFFKFKNDSLSGKLNSNEFRLMLDANYYWHRFTVGLRYNQALSNYVSIQISNNSPLFTDKNKSLQFYLRYNLWEDRKRKKTGLMANR